MQIDAMTELVLVAPQIRVSYDLLLIGANQRMMRCSQFVGNEQIVPNKQSTKMAKRTVWCACLKSKSAFELTCRRASYGSNVGMSPSIVCITAVARIICEMVYARLATPAA